MIFKLLSRLPGYLLKTLSISFSHFFLAFLTPNQGLTIPKISPTLSNPVTACVVLNLARKFSASQTFLMAILLWSYSNNNLKGGKPHFIFPWDSTEVRPLRFFHLLNVMLLKSRSKEISKHFISIFGLYKTVSRTLDLSLPVRKLNCYVPAPPVAATAAVAIRISPEGAPWETVQVAANALPLLPPTAIPLLWLRDR